MRPFKLVRSNLLGGVAVVLIFSSCGGGPSRPVVRAPTPSPTGTGVSASSDAPAPTVTISALPTTIERRDPTTLTWQSTDASSLVIDSGVGNVDQSGSMVVAPLESTTYTATATGPGGDTKSSTRVTVAPRSNDASLTSTDLERLQRAIDEGQVEPIFFAYDKAQLTAEARETLEANARVFRQYERVSVIIEGHCDERGTEEYNLALGDRRAQAVKNYLVGLGIPGSRLETISFGEERPFSPDHTEAAFRQNRRAHFVVNR
ncbi:MAG: peptidoglycan-associated lipoprotein Pal [Acidobacteriota bacterium]|nr:peptidoglycan-associated lipoprotein Pal [Acidobacteriota bacterium]